MMMRAVSDQVPGEVAAGTQVRDEM
jgi:hypothetical protein